MYFHSASIENDFERQVEEFVCNFYCPKTEYSPTGSKVLVVESKMLAFNLMPLGKYLLYPNTMQDIANEYRLRGLQVIHLWEDIWRSRNIQVKSVIQVKLGFARTVFARKTETVKLAKTELDAFMEENHLMGSALCKYKYGLTLSGNLVAAAAFAPIRKYYQKDGFDKSSELVRFANANGLIVTGGLSKLISHFVKERNVNDIMSYADKDWSNGNAYKLLGFIEAVHTLPMAFVVDEQNCARIPVRQPELSKKVIYNTGNIKFKIKVK